MTNAKASKAVKYLLEIARDGFAEPNGHASNCRFSINGNQLEIMHGKRAPLEWVVIPISLEKE
jgi:hypothetical protein